MVGAFFKGAFSGKVSIWLVLFLFLLSCSTSYEKNGQVQEALFYLSLGKLPSQLYLFSEDKFIPNTRDYIRAVRGTIYISDKASQKIMGFTSYGNLIYLLQNSNANPSSNVSNFISVNYPFTNIGLIEISPQGIVYVQEEMPSIAQVFDAKEGMVLENRILRFDSKGQFKDYLGQQGIGSEPFGIILQMNTSAKGDLFVLSQFPNKKVVYWFNSEGALIWRLNLDEASLPIPNKENPQQLLASLQNVFPSPNENKIYLNIVYYQTMFDQQTNGEVGIQIKEQRVYGYNLNNKTYEENILLPPYKDKDNDMNYLLDMMGLTGNNLVFRLADNNLVDMTFILINRKSYRIGEHKLVFPNAENLDLSLSPEGLLTGMFLERNKVGVYWWPMGEMSFGN